MENASRRALKAQIDEKCVLLEERRGWRQVPDFTEVPEEVESYRRRGQARTHGKGSSDLIGGFPCVISVKTATLDLTPEQIQTRRAARNAQRLRVIESIATNNFRFKVRNLRGVESAPHSEIRFHPTA